MIRKDHYGQRTMENVRQMFAINASIKKYVSRNLNPARPEMETQSNAIRGTEAMSRTP